ncbi:lipid II:glycine glycyltransferase FemX [Georgenia faecalis]|uniref:lipid II:glycine glycyltransferase FemX n=1 Tax=Georgenia faecalis TaxID=2483799 RepID=UPI000FDC2CD6|nr:GNAT family N-acetyltransferase [Georgenia faecalis]
MSETMAGTALAPVDDETYTRLAAGTALPIEQALVWADFDEVVPGREHWGRLAFQAGGEVVAVLSLTQVDGPAGVRYLWAKNGPVWLTEPTPELERALRERLVAALRRAAPRVAFVRLHAHHAADDLRDVLQGITYDRTVVVDLAREEEDIFAAMKQQGRRAIRKALKDDSLAVAEETGLDEAAFAELYDVLVETGAREGFGPHPARRYLDMLRTLGAEHARVFVVRREGRVLAWALVVVNDGEALYSVGASNAEARGAYAADLLHWHIIRTLAAEGVTRYDLAGAGSERFPGLNGLTQFKTKFEKNVTEVAPAWDLPVAPARYEALERGLAAKRAARRLARELPGAARRLVGRLRGRGGAADAPAAAPSDGGPAAQD